MSTTEPDLTKVLDPAERRLALGHRLMVLGHLKTKFRQSREHLNRYRNQGMDQAMGKQEGTVPTEGADDMLVLGNVTVTTQPAADPAQPPEPQKPSALSRVMPYVLTALTTAGGLGGAGWAAGLFDQPEPPAVEQPADFPTPPGYGLSL